MVAAAVDYSMDDGLSQIEACNEVYKVLKRGGVRPQRRGQKITSTTVSNWRDEVHRAKDETSAAVIAHKSMRMGAERKYINGLSTPKERKDYVLGRLAEYICRVLPPEIPPKL